MSRIIHAQWYDRHIRVKFDDINGRIYVSNSTVLEYWQDFRTYVPRDRMEEKMIKQLTPHVFNMIDASKKSLKTLEEFLTPKEWKVFKDTKLVCIDSKLIEGMAYSIDFRHPKGIKAYNKAKPTKYQNICYHVRPDYQDSPIGDVLLSLALKIKTDELGLLREKHLDYCLENLLFREHDDNDNDNDWVAHEGRIPTVRFGGEDLAYFAGNIEVVVMADAPIQAGQLVSSSDLRAGTVVPYGGDPDVRPIGICLNREPVATGEAVEIRLL